MLGEGIYGGYYLVYVSSKNKNWDLLRIYMDFWPNIVWSSDGHSSKAEFLFQDSGQNGIYNHQYDFRSGTWTWGELNVLWQFLWVKKSDKHQIWDCRYFQTKSYTKRVVHHPEFVDIFIDGEPPDFWMSNTRGLLKIGVSQTIGFAN